MPKRSEYASDLSAKQCEIIRHVLPKPAVWRRKTIASRNILNWKPVRLGSPPRHDDFGGGCGDDPCLAGQRGRLDPTLPLQFPDHRRNSLTFLFACGVRIASIAEQRRQGLMRALGRGPLLNLDRGVLL